MRKRIYNKLAVLAISGIVALSSNSLWAMGASSYPEKSLNKEVVTQNSELSKKEKLEIDVKGKKITEEKELTQEELIDQLKQTELNALYLLDTSGSRTNLIKETYKQTDEWINSMTKMNVTRYAWDYTSHYESGTKVDLPELKPVKKVIESTIKKDLSIIKLVKAMKENITGDKPNFFIYETDMEDQFLSEDMSLFGNWMSEKRTEAINLFKRVINDVYNQTGAKSILIVDKANKILENNLPFTVKNSSGTVIGTVIDSLDARETALNNAFSATVKTTQKVKTEKTVYPNYTFKAEKVNGEDLENKVTVSFNNKELGNYDDKSTLEEVEFSPKDDGKLVLEINSKAKELKEKEQVFKVSIFEDGKLKESKEIKFRAKIVKPAGTLEDIATKTTKEEVEIPFETERKENSELPKGEERVVVKGENGKKIVTTVTVGEKGEPKVTEEVIKKPVNEVIEVGTKIVKPTKVISTGSQSVEVIAGALLSLSMLSFLGIRRKSRNKQN